eukprot:TsM_000912200 transcript=TsM_000912200 gene=TsM_000912200
MLKSVLQFSLVLFLTTIWAVGSGEGKGSIAKRINGENVLASAILQLDRRWNVTQLPRRYADVVILAAGTTAPLFFTMNFTTFFGQSLTLRGLKPNTTYNVTVELMKHYRVFAIFDDIVTTKARAYSRGNLTLRGLKPNTTYNVTVELMKYNVVFAIFDDVVTTRTRARRRLTGFFGSTAKYA